MLNAPTDCCLHKARLQTQLPPRPNLAHPQVAVPETYAVFKGRLLDLIYDRAVQIQPAAALQASRVAAAV